MALKKGSKKTLDLLLSNPKLSATEAYIRTHQTENRTTARNNAFQLLRKPEAKIYMQEHVNRARETVVELLNSKKDDIRLRASQDIIDREYGKAKQLTEVTSTGITLNIDLTSSLDEA